MTPGSCGSTSRRPGQAPFTLDHAPSLGAAFNRLGQGVQPDVALLDLSLPDSHGSETWARLLDTAPALPFIVLTGFDDESSAVNAVREGAQDYLVKARIDGNALFQSIRYAVERKRAAEALRRANEELERRVEERTGALRDANAHLRSRSTSASSPRRRSSSSCASSNRPAPPWRRPTAPRTSSWPR